jgi:hypothetical protein
MDVLRRLFRRSQNTGKEWREHGYHQLPSTLQSATRRESVDKGNWQICGGCGRQVPVVEDWSMQANGTRSKIGTYTYVCPFCDHSHVGTEQQWNQDLSAQVACHSCGTRLRDAYQCPQCQYPRGWMRVNCPYCGNEQPVFAPHFVLGCDMFTLECVHCESRFISLCVC